MSENFFFKRKGPFKLNDLFKKHQILSQEFYLDVNTLEKASADEITFFDSVIYKDSAIKTKSNICITTEKLKTFLPKTCKPIIVKNVLYELAKILSMFYDNADIDYPDMTLTAPNKSNYPNVKFGQALFFLPYIYHGSDINKTNETRFSLNIRFKGLFTPSGKKFPLHFFRLFKTSKLTKLALQKMKEEQGK